MKIRVFKKEPEHAAEKYTYFSMPFIERYILQRTWVIKNYVLDPDIKFLNK